MAMIDNKSNKNLLNNHQFLRILLNTCTLLSSMFAIVVSLLIINYIIINLLRKRQVKKSSIVFLLLTCNTYLSIICSSCTMILMSLSSLAGDLNIENLRLIINWACHTRGYLHFTFINAIYLSYVLQAAFRLCRIAFHKYRCLRTIYSSIICILIQWILSFLLILPILIAKKDHSTLITYLPNEFFCQVPLDNIRGIVFSILTVYFVPLCCIGLIYLWILTHIRAKNYRSVFLMISPIRRRNKRDGIIIKRICLLVLVLLLLGLPSCLFVMFYIITGHLHWAAYRIGWMTISISFALISLSSIYVTPQLYRPIRKIFDRSRINQRNRANSTSTTNNIEPQRRITQTLIRNIPI